MSPQELRKTGERLYGRHWQKPLAVALKISTRTIRYWLSGEIAVRETNAIAIRALETQALKE